MNQVYMVSVLGFGLCGCHVGGLGGCHGGQRVRWQDGDDEACMWSGEMALSKGTGMVQFQIGSEHPFTGPHGRDRGSGSHGTGAQSTSMVALGHAGSPEMWVAAAQGGGLD